MSKAPHKNGDKKGSKVDRQIKEAGLPTGGTFPFDPQLEKNRKGKTVIRQETEIKR